MVIENIYDWKRNPLGLTLVSTPEKRALYRVFELGTNQSLLKKFYNGEVMEYVDGDGVSHQCQDII